MADDSALKHLRPDRAPKEIEEDQNTALAILIGSVFINLAMVIAEGWPKPSVSGIRSC